MIANGGAVPQARGGMFPTAAAQKVVPAVLQGRQCRRQICLSARRPPLQVMFRFFYIYTAFYIKLSLPYIKGNFAAYILYI